MTHPSSEQWMAFLYGELPPPQYRELAGHLETCPDCQRAVAAWRQTMTVLDRWQVATPRRNTLRHSAIPWAAAALLMLGLGGVAGRLSAPRVDRIALAAELAPALRDHLRQQFNADLQATLQAASDQTDRKLVDLAAAWTSAREEDRQATVALYSQTERRRLADLAWLRRDLETVAVSADERFDTTQRSLGQLVAYSQSVYDRPDALAPVNSPLNER